jgi:hypothetical protein
MHSSPLRVLLRGTHGSQSARQLRVGGHQARSICNFLHLIFARTVSFSYTTALVFD